MPEQDYLVAKFSLRRKHKGKGAKDWEAIANQNAVEVRHQRARADSAMRVLSRDREKPFMSTWKGKGILAGTALAGAGAMAGGVGMYNRSKRKAESMGLSAPEPVFAKADLRAVKRIIPNSRRTNGRFGYNLQVKKALGIPGVPKPRISAGFRTMGVRPPAAPTPTPRAGRLSATGGRIGGVPGPTAPRLPGPVKPRVR